MNKTVAALLVLALLLVAGLWWWMFGALRERPAAQQPPPVAPAAPPPEEAPPVSFAPIDPPPALGSEAPVDTQALLPALADSDSAILTDAQAAAGRWPLDLYLLPRQVIRRMVATIDNLPRERLPLATRSVPRIAGSFAAMPQDGRFVLAQENFARYTPFVDMATGVDAQAMFAVYRRYHSLFQAAYAELGYGNRSFDARLIEVIDHLLRAPTPERPVTLVQPRVFFEFEDAELEALSAGHKMLIRMGPENADRLKTRLREFRALLAAG